MTISEYEYMTQVIIPYLEDNWGAIDNISSEDKGSGRLTREKIFIKYLDAMSTRNIHEAIVLESIIERYDQICLAHEDAYIPEEEPLIGITEEDISVYTQQVANKRVEEIRPYRWLPAQAS